MMKFDLKMPDFIFGIESGLIKIFIPPFILIIVFIISFNLIITPQIENIKTISKTIESVKKEIKTVTEKKNYLLSVDKEELRKNSWYMENALLKEKQSYYLVGVIRSIADKHGFQVKSFSISPGELKSEDVVKIANTDVLNKAPVDITLLGQKDKHLDLLLALEKSLPIITINNIDIKTFGGVAELKLNISSFYMTNTTSSNIASLTLNDLTLKKDETDLLSRLSQFEEARLDVTNVTEEAKKEYIKYERQNPFSL